MKGLPAPKKSLTHDCLYTFLPMQGSLVFWKCTRKEPHPIYLESGDNVEDLCSSREQSLEHQNPAPFSMCSMPLARMSCKAREATWYNKRVHPKKLSLRSLKS